MKSLKQNKLIAFLSLILLLIFSFLLFSGIKNSILNIPDFSFPHAVYIYLVIIVILGLILFTISINLSYKNLTGTLSQEKEIIELHKETEASNLDDIEDHKQTINLEQLSKKILPSEDPSKNLDKYSEKILSNIAKEFDIVQGIIFYKNKKEGTFNVSGKYAYYSEEEPKAFKEGESLSGQAAKNKKVLNLSELPDNYITILSGLGSSSPNNLLIIPIINNKETIGILELASFKKFDTNLENKLVEISNIIGENVKKHLNT